MNDTEYAQGQVNLIWVVSLLVQTVSTRIGSRRGKRLVRSEPVWMEGVRVYGSVVACGRMEYKYPDLTKVQDSEVGQFRV